MCRLSLHALTRMMCLFTHHLCISVNFIHTFRNRRSYFQKSTRSGYRLFRARKAYTTHRCVLQQQHTHTLIHIYFAESFLFRHMFVRIKIISNKFLMSSTFSHCAEARECRMCAYCLLAVSFISIFVAREIYAAIRLPSLIWFAWTFTHGDLCVCLWRSILEGEKNNSNRYLWDAIPSSLSADGCVRMNIGNFQEYYHHFPFKYSLCCLYKSSITLPKDAWIICFSFSLVLMYLCMHTDTQNVPMTLHFSSRQTVHILISHIISQMNAWHRAG